MCHNGEMDVLEAIKKRRAIRRYDPGKDVTGEQIEKLLEAARWAPSAGNLQGRFIIVVRDKVAKERLVEAAWGQSFIAAAPVVFVFCADLERSASKYGNRGRELYAIQDATLAAQNLWLAATEMSLAAGWVGAFDEEEVSRILDLEENLRPITIMPLGYPAKLSSAGAESPSPPPRRAISEISKQV